MPDDQPPLPGVAPAAGVNHHVFFAVLADADAGQKADRLCDEEMALRHLAGSKVRRERLHVTLVSLWWAAEFPERKALLARWAAAQVDAPPAFPLRLDRYLSFQLRNARRPLALLDMAPGWPVLWISTARCMARSIVHFLVGSVRYVPHLP